MTPGDATVLSEEQRVEAVLAAVPTWAGSALTYALAVPPVMSPTHRAVDSSCWAVDVGSPPERYFLKIMQPDVAPFVDLPAACDAAQKAAALGVTPALCHVLPDHDAAIFDRLGPEWRTARLDDLQHEAVIGKVLAAQKAIQDGPRFQRDWTVFERLRHLVHLSDAEGVSLAADEWWLREAVADIEQALMAAGMDSKPCHANLVSSNVMIGPGGTVQLVDFDVAGNTDPYYDLGILLNEAFVFEADMRPVVEARDGVCRDTAVNRCRLYAVADDLLWGTWAGLLNTTSPRRNVEFLKYAQWRLLRCRMAIRDPRFEAQLRHL